MPSKQIFGDENKSANNESEFSQSLQKKKLAEYERLKGNEAMKSKDYSDAITAYSKSIEIFPDEAATYSNRAMAYINQKEYARAIDDANVCIKIDPEYIKGYYRRGKSYKALHKYDLAIRDF